jgi:hypothetical protein
MDFIFGFACGFAIAFLLLGLYFKRAKTKYNGTIIVTKTMTKTLYSLEFDDDPAEIANKKEVIFHVQKDEAPE